MQPATQQANHAHEHPAIPIPTFLEDYELGKNPWMQQILKWYKKNLYYSPYLPRVEQIWLPRSYREFVITVDTRNVKKWAKTHQYPLNEWDKVWLHEADLRSFNIPLLTVGQYLLGTLFAWGAHDLLFSGVKTLRSRVIATMWPLGIFPAFLVGQLRARHANAESLIQHRTSPLGDYFYSQLKEINPHHPWFIKYPQRGTIWDYDITQKHPRYFERHPGFAVSSRDGKPQRWRYL